MLVKRLQMTYQGTEPYLTLISRLASSTKLQVQNSSVEVWDSEDKNEGLLELAFPMHGNITG